MMDTWKVRILRKTVALSKARSHLAQDKDSNASFLHACTCAKSLRSCPTLCDPPDCSPAGSSVHGILQARILERVAVPSSRGSSRPGDGTCISYVSCDGGQVRYH